MTCCCDLVQVAKAAAHEQNMAVAGALLERLPGIAQDAADQGDERLLNMLQERGHLLRGETGPAYQRVCGKSVTSFVVVAGAHLTMSNGVLDAPCLTMSEHTRRGGGWPGCEGAAVKPKALEGTVEPVGPV